MLRKTVNIIAWLVGGSVALVVLFFLMLLVVNWRDASPSAISQQFDEYYATRPSVSDSDNGFLYMLGMAVETGLDPAVAGRAMVARSQELQGKYAPAYEYSHPDFPQFNAADSHTPSIKALLDTCKTFSESCVPLIEKDSAVTRPLSVSDALLLERYHKLIALNGWYELYPGGMDGPLPPYYAAVSAQTLWLYQAWLYAPQRGVDATLLVLEQDYRFWRMALSNADSMLSSMFAAAALRRNFYWSNLVLRRFVGDKMQVSIGWLSSLTSAERSLQRALIGEWSLAEAKHRRELFAPKSNQEPDATPVQVSRLAQWLLKPLYLPQDTINRRAEYSWALIQHYRMPYEQVARNTVEIQSQSESQSNDGLSFPRYFYNPTGKILIEFIKTEYDEFPRKIADLEGGRRALLVTLELRNNKTPRHKVAERLVESSWRNPYTDEPFTWDDSAGCVVFDGLGKRGMRRYSFIY